MSARTEAHILVVDDDERLRDLLQKFLVTNGYRASVARDAMHAGVLMEGLEFDLIVLDVMMPGEDGITFAAGLRENRVETPILMLTARSESNQRIMGLEAGADDFLGKPFEPRELLLRINAILRRVPEKETGEAQPKTLYLGSRHYDIMRGELWHEGQPVRLTATEAVLMRVFSSRPGEAFSRTDLVEILRRTGSKAQRRAVDVQITRLRKKIEDEPRSPRYLQTVRGSGYMLVPD